MPVGINEIRQRFGFHKGTEETIPKHELNREGFIAFAQFLDELLPDGRAKSTCMTNLQVASMWANFAIAEVAPLEEPQPTTSVAVSSVVAVTTTATDTAE